MEEAENGRERENKRKCNMVLPKLIGQERIIANPDP